LLDNGLLKHVAGTTSWKRPLLSNARQTLPKRRNSRAGPRIICFSTQLFMYVSESVSRFIYHVPSDKLSAVQVNCTGASRVCGSKPNLFAVYFCVSRAIVGATHIEPSASQSARTAAAPTRTVTTTYLQHDSRSRG
jgi:hypothetical protein